MERFLEKLTFQQIPVPCDQLQLEIPVREEVILTRIRIDHQSITNSYLINPLLQSLSSRSFCIRNQKNLKVVHIFTPIPTPSSLSKSLKKAQILFHFL